MNRQFYRLLGASTFLSLSAIAQAGLEPVDSLQEKVYTHKSKTARSVKTAFEALKTKKFSQTHKLAQSIEKDPLFADYGIWLDSSAVRAQAAEALSGKRFSEAASLATKAIQMSSRIEIEYPYSPFLKNLYKEIAEAEIIAGDANTGLKNWRLVGAYFDRGLQHLQLIGSLNQMRPSSLGNFAQYCAKTNDLYCEGWMQKFANFYSRSSQEMRAMTKYVPDLPERGHYTHALTKATQSYKAPDLDQAAFDAAMILFLTEKYDQSEKSFRQFLDDFPKSTYRFRARYWLSEALVRQKEDDKAKLVRADLQKDSPLTFYGLLASFGTGKEIEGAIEAATPKASTSDPGLLPHEILRLRRTESLLAEGCVDLASSELKEFRSRDALSSPFLMYLAALHNELKNYSSSFSILSELFQRGYEGIYSTYTLRMIFPVEYFDTIKKYANEFKIDPVLVLSLMKQESAFDKQIGSNVGAIGLMQLMPATAGDMMPDVARADLVDADLNIQLGTKYLARLLNRFNGNIVLALAGYNAGPGAADRWMKDSPPKRGMLEFIESIPFKETREYVTSIIRNYYWYSKKLNVEPSKKLSYFWNIYGPPESPAVIPQTPNDSAAATSTMLENIKRQKTRKTASVQSLPKSLFKDADF